MAAQSKYSQASSPLVSTLGHHKDAISFSLLRLWHFPISTWVTLAAIAIALSLPASLYLFLSNLKSLTDDKHQVPTISLFIKKGVSEQQARDRGELLQEMPEIDKVVLITDKQALEEVQKISGLSFDSLRSPEDNPLPHVLVITPHTKLLGDPELDMRKLARRLKSYPEIKSIVMDIEWVRRLRAILRITERILLIVAILLGMTVLLVIGNTIRLNIENRKEEIEVSKLIGATTAYIRRPFLYTGIWYGLFGGIISLVLVHIALLFLVSPVNDLAELYDGQFSINGVGIKNTLYILLTSSLLGLVGAWLAVGKHLKKI